MNKSFFKLQYSTSANLLYLDTNCFAFDKNKSAGEHFEENNKCIYYVLDSDWTNIKPYRFVENNIVYLGIIILESTKSVTIIANIANKRYCATIKIPKPLYPPVFTGEIYYLQDLDRIRENLSFNCTLMNDLDFTNPNSYDHTDPNWEAKKLAWTTGKGWTPIHNFSGIFEGSNYRIINLFIHNIEEFVAYSPNHAGGLFNSNNGTIENLRIQGNITDCIYSGMLCVWNNGTISKCSSSGCINNIDVAFACLGGLVAFNEGIINNSFSTCSISIDPLLDNDALFSSYDSEFEFYMGYVFIGGLVGNTNLLYDPPYSSATITNCYAATYITPPVIPCYGLGIGGIGGIIGGLSQGEAYPVDISAITEFCSLNITSSYYDSDRSGLTDTLKGSPRTTSEMKDQATYIDWDFISVWYIDFYTPDYPIFFVFTE